MTQSEFTNSKINMEMGIIGFSTNKLLKSFIPEKINLTLNLLLNYWNTISIAIFKSGKLLSLSIFNLIAWYHFVKVSYVFIKNMYQIWK